MKITAWNIYQGGAGRAESILSVLENLNPDVIVLSEYHPERSRSLLKLLSDKGWGFQSKNFSETSGAGIAVISRVKFVRLDEPDRAPKGRWIQIRIPSEDLVLCAAYGPLQSRPKGEFWDWMISEVQPLLNQRTIIIGDLNNGLFPGDHPEHARPLPKWKKMQELIAAGWCDLYRNSNPEGRDRSWWTAKSAGFRIDHAFVSPPLIIQSTSVKYWRSIDGVDIPIVDTNGASAGWSKRVASDHALLEVTLASQLREAKLA